MSALSRQTYTDFDVLIVDNASTDGSVGYLEELCGKGLRLLPCSDGSVNSGAAAASVPVTAIYMDKNTGFSGAVNAGIRKTASEYVILLNNDTEPQPDYIKELVRALDEDTDKKIFAVSPKMIQLYHKDFLDDAGDGYSLLGWAYQRGVGQSTSRAKFQSAANIFSACAGAAIYRRSVFEELKFSDGDYFDEKHFAYLEDLDICFRARVHGYQNVYAPLAEVFHVGSGTSGSKYNEFKVRLAARNNVWLNYKNMPLLMLLINLPFILAGVLIKQLFFAKLGFGRNYLGGFTEGLKKLGDIRPHKTCFRASRLLTYIGIEMHIIAGTFSYIDDFLYRRFHPHH